MSVSKGHEEARFAMLEVVAVSTRCSVKRGRAGQTHAMMTPTPFEYFWRAPKHWFQAARP